MSNHPDTLIYSPGDWFPKTVFLENISQPACISIDIRNIFHPELPNIFIQVEPNIICDNRDYLIENKNKYQIILTFDKYILDYCSNSKFYVYGTTWIPKEIYSNLDMLKKEFKISTLASSKLINNAAGHHFRQIIHHNQTLLNNFPITFFRSLRTQPYLTDYGDNPFLEFDSKTGLFEEFEFSIVVENSQQENYFTEKLIDCLLTKTIPIYWGCPNISEFFNTSGWIILTNTTIEELISKLQSLTSSYYSNYKQIILENYEKAEKYANLYKNINNAK